MPKYSQALKDIAKEGAYLRKPTETCFCGQCKRPLPVRVAYSERTAGKWVGVCFDCDKATVPVQTGPSPDHQRRIEAVRAQDQQELEDRKFARALQRAEAKHAKVPKSPRTPKRPSTPRTPRAVGSATPHSEPGTPETPHVAYFGTPRARQMPGTPRTPKTPRTPRTPKTPRTPTVRALTSLKTAVAVALTTAKGALTSSQPSGRELSPIELVSDGEESMTVPKPVVTGAVPTENARADGTAVKASYELELTDEEVDGVPRTVVKDLVTQTSYMLPVRNSSSKAKQPTEQKTAKKRVAEGDEPESDNDIIIPVGEKHQRKWMKLARVNDGKIGRKVEKEEIVISSDSEEGEPGVAAAPAAVVECGREGSVGSMDSDEEDGPHLLKSHDNRQRLVRVVIWTGLEEKRYAKVEETFVYLGLTKVGKLVHGPLKLPPDTRIELWDKAESTWAGEYTSESQFWVDVDRKGIWGRVIGSGAVGTDFWEEMKRLQTGATSVPFEWLVDYENRAAQEPKDD